MQPHCFLLIEVRVYSIGVDLLHVPGADRGILVMSPWQRPGGGPRGEAPGSS